MKETELYLPVKRMFESLGYSVQGEVNNIDVLAIKNDEIVIIELKTAYNLKLILQAIERQRITSMVYIAIPRPAFKKRINKSIKDKEHLLRRLELGLIYIATDVKLPYAQIVFDPKPFHMKHSQSYKRKKLILKELSERTGDYNIGGSNGKLITAYREKALVIVNLLKEHKTLSVREIREKSRNEKAQALLSNNHYGWFERVKKGYYQLSEQGHEAYEIYKNIILLIT